MLNQQIQNYKIISPLGEGGMAKVYLAEHNLLGSNTAIKLLNKEFTHNDNIRKRFLAEARSMARMSHPNIIKVTDLIDEGDTVAFVMEYVNGKTLKEYIDRKGKLSDEDIKSIFSQMLEAVGYVHKQNLVHRDIKPSNFMIDPEGKVKLMDFGIAKTTETTSPEYTQTGTGVQMGTPMYMSPEQITATKSVTPQSDIYSLGVVLWQMVTGQKPYDTKTLSTFQLQMKIVQEKLPKTNTKWDLLINGACTKDPNLRFRSCESFKNEINNTKTYFSSNHNEDATLIEDNYSLCIFDRVDNYTSGDINDLFNYTTRNSSSVLVVWLDEQNIFFFPLLESESKFKFFIAVNPFIDFLSQTKIISFFNSILEWKIERYIFVESAIALGIRKELINKNEDNNYNYAFKYKNNFRTQEINVGSRVIEMCPDLNIHKIQSVGEFSELNTNEWIGISLKGLYNLNDLLLGKNNVLLLDNFGFEIKLNNTILVEKNSSLPSIKEELFFFSKESSLNYPFLKISSPLSKNSDLNQEIIKLEDFKDLIKELSYNKAIELKNNFIVCNNSGQQLTQEPLKYTSVSADREYYQFNELGESFIPKDWLYILDVNDQIILNKKKSLFIFILTIKISHNRGFDIFLNGHKIYSFLGGGGDVPDYSFD